MKQPNLIISLTLIMISFLSCANKNQLETVANLDINRYSGTWYEIAKLPNSFEKNLTCVSATYTVGEKGKIKVYNKGYNTKKEEWEEITGKAKVPNSASPGEIKVSFFGPFYGDYFVIDIDQDYQTALIGSPSRKYLWILSRKADLPANTIQDLLNKAKDLDFEVSKVEMTIHNCD